MNKGYVNKPGWARNMKRMDIYRPDQNHAVPIYINHKAEFEAEVDGVRVKSESLKELYRLIREEADNTNKLEWSKMLMVDRWDMDWRLVFVADLPGGKQDIREIDEVIKDGKTTEVKGRSLSSSFSIRKEVMLEPTEERIEALKAIGRARKEFEARRDAIANSKELVRFIDMVVADELEVSVPFLVPTAEASAKTKKLIEKTFGKLEIEEDEDD